MTNQFTARDGQVLDLGADRELAETCLPFGLVEVLEEFAAAARLGKRKREHLASAGWRILDTEADRQRHLQLREDPERWAAKRAQVAAWKAEHREQARERERRWRAENPDEARERDQRAYRKRMADPVKRELVRKRLAEEQRKRRATPEGRKRSQEEARARYHAKKRAAANDDLSLSSRASPKRAGGR